jgi:hypothetical protein
LITDFLFAGTWLAVVFFTRNLTKLQQDETIVAHLNCVSTDEIPRTTRLNIPLDLEGLEKRVQNNKCACSFMKANVPS